MKKIIILIILLFSLSNVVLASSNGFIIGKIISPYFYLNNNVQDRLLEPLNGYPIYLTNVYYLKDNLIKIDGNILKKLKDTANYNIGEVVVFYGDFKDYEDIKNIIFKYIGSNNYIIGWRGKTTSLVEPSYYIKCKDNEFILKNIYGSFEKEEEKFLLKKLKEKFKTCNDFKKEFGLTDYSYRKNNDYNKFFSNYKHYILSKYGIKIKGLSLDKKLKLLSRIDKLRNKIENKNLSIFKKERINILLDALVEVISENINKSY